MGIKNIVKKAGEKAGNQIARMAALSPEQVADIEKRRQDYLSQMPDPSDAQAEELTARLLAANSVEIYNAYLSQLHDLYVPIQKDAEYGEPFQPAHNIRYFNITKWVTDKKENSLEKLVNVYEVLSNEECNIALIFHRDMAGTTLYLAVTNTKNADDNQDVVNYRRRLADAVHGNFPGSEWTDDAGVGIVPCLKNDEAYSVAAATNIPTEKSEKFISQTIEKLLDGVVPDSPKKAYTLILLATPVQDIEERKLRLAEFYSGLAPYAGWSTTFTLNEQNTAGSTATVGINVGASAGVQHGQNSALTNTAGSSQSSGRDISESFDTAKGVETGENVSAGVNIGQGVSPVSGEIQKGISSSESTTNSVGHAVARTLGKAISESAAVTHGLFSSTNLGANFGANFARSSNVTATIGKGEGITQQYTNYTIKHTLALLEEQMKRYEQSAALGMWDFAAYVLSEDHNVANNVAHSYLALTQGEKSYMSHTAVNVWRGDMGEASQDAREICGYLRELRHPLFGLNTTVTAADPTYNVYPSVVTATTSLTGKELAYSLNFPKKSVAGLPVLSCAEFGRNVVTYGGENPADEALVLGHIFHMHHMENTTVRLSKTSLASHTFVTGSTGSGKSNTIYQILSEAMKAGVHFLVIEPAKGEYKDIFGSRDDVAVYGTNPALTPLLKLNPFAFPKGIHVFEHIDRLVEIFNVCWPMYAAMPAVLKDAVEKAYEDCGWDLTASTNPYGEDLVPDFSDVARNVKIILAESEYDAENKGAYTGSLLTRLKSLTNGINGLIFTADAIPMDALFDQNVIVDLSRVGSNETKALIMGMFVLKLQEYRMVSAAGGNQALKHLTVLEEAHNLLKRTSTEQPTEGGNLLGKSVEMLTNAIAEMRTYGEGFIIADQAAGLLDKAVIRNTNTKIIMRLPDEEDRELVGRAAGLNDDQIAELAKLPRGVGAVYQNEWLQPVLCKINYFDDVAGRYQYEPLPEKAAPFYAKKRAKLAKALSESKQMNHQMIGAMREQIDVLHLKASVTVAILKLLLDPPEEPRMSKLAPVMAALFPSVEAAVADSYQNVSDVLDMTRSAERVLEQLGLNDLDAQVNRDIVQGVITHYLLFVKNDAQKLQDWGNRGGGFYAV